MSASGYSTNGIDRMTDRKLVVSPALLILALVAAFVGGLRPTLAAAADTGASAWAETPHGAVRLISATTATGSAGETEIALGLEFRMADGWKIYWRYAGDAGYPPAIDWSGSENLAGTQIAWPVPVRFSILGFETLGYEQAVTLPIEAQLRQPGAPLRLKASVDYLTCKDICVPYVADLTLDVPAGPAAATAHAATITAARARVPMAPGADGPRIERATMSTNPTATGQEAVLHIVARSPAAFVAPDVFVEGPAALAFGAPTLRLADGARTVAFDVPVHGLADYGRPLVGEVVTLTLTDGGRGVEQRVTVAVAEDGAARPPSPLLLMLGIAWLGGLILNLMPCVLPVLSIKLLGVVAHGGGERRAIRLGFLASAAGIIVSFWVIAAALLIVQAAGGLVGWGLQFQQPWFLVVMTLILVLFACNLWGWFEIPLPRFLGDAGSAIGHVRGLGGQFLSGALATLLATPCSAPFVGSAIGFALAATAPTVVLVFTAMALGLATPYLLIALVPALAQRLPRPGSWMRIVRRVLGLALLATAGWLLSVLAANTGVATAIVVGCLALVVVGVIAMAAFSARGWQPLTSTVAAVAIAAALLAPWLMPHDPRMAANAETNSRWAPFEPERIAALVATGNIVFVNVTADWCLTCKVNEKVVLARSPVRERLSELDVVAMQADWTRADERISRYLASFGRYGIPFDAVYGPGVPGGEALPEVLTPEMVIEALARAGGVGLAGSLTVGPTAVGR
jgi:suppressor for copper-sensitivity B